MTNGADGAIEYGMDDMEVLGDDRVEIPVVTGVRWKDGHSGNSYDIGIKFVSTRGVGFPYRMHGARWIGFTYGTECAMPDGTVLVLESANGKYLEASDRDAFMHSIVDWAVGHSLGARSARG